MLTEQIKQALATRPEYLIQQVSTDEAARLLGVTKRCLENWRVRGGGPEFVSRSRGHVRYLRLSLIEWTEKHLRSNTSQEREVAHA